MGPPGGALHAATRSRDTGGTGPARACPAQHQRAGLPGAVRPRSRKPCVSHGVPPNHQVWGLLSSTARQREGPGDRSALPPLALVLHVSPLQPPKPVLSLTPSLSHGLGPGPPRAPTGQQEGAAQEPAPKAAPTQGLGAWPGGAARAPGAQCSCPPRTRSAAGEPVAPSSSYTGSPHTGAAREGGTFSPSVWGASQVHAPLALHPPPWALRPGAPPRT